MSADAGDKDGVDIALVAGGHRPQHVLGVENIHVFVHQDNMFELRKRRQGGERRLPLRPLVGGAAS